MLSTFDLGHKGEAVVNMGLSRVYANPVETPKDINLQLKWADFVCKGDKNLGIPHLKVEVKTELKHTGNLFIETHSNVEAGRPGWAETSTADELFYLFWEEAIGYRLPDFQNFKWLFDYHKNNFKEVDQKKTTQTNLTRGRLVPIQWVSGCFTGLVRFDFSNDKELLEQKLAV